MPPVPRRRSTRYRPPSTSPTGSAAETMPMAPPLRRLRPPNPARDPGTPTHLLANHDPAAHRRAVHRAIVLIGPRRGERDRVGLPIAGLDGAARETGRPLRLDAVRHRSRGGPGPRDRAADRDGVDRGGLSPVVGALEEHVPDHDLTGRTPTPTPTAATTATTAVRGGLAARERSQRQQADYRCCDTHFLLLCSPPCASSNCSQFIRQRHRAGGASPRCLDHGGKVSDRFSMAVSDATAGAGAKQRNRFVGLGTTSSPPIPLSLRERGDYERTFAVLGHRPTFVVPPLRICGEGDRG